jgi:hypothetical protein
MVGKLLLESPLLLRQVLACYLARDAISASIFMPIPNGHEQGQQKREAEHTNG